MNSEYTEGSERYSNADSNSQARRGTQKKYHGNYLGIVVQNNDPQQRGRVKVWVPHINCSVYSSWDKLSKDRKFKIMGSNVDSDLSSILHDLKSILPWGDVMGPIVGAVGSGRYNANHDVASISDSAQVRTITPREEGDDDKNPLNKDYMTGMTIPEACLTRLTNFRLVIYLRVIVIWLRVRFLYLTSVLMYGYSSKPGIITIQ